MKQVFLGFAHGTASVAFGEWHDSLDAGVFMFFAIGIVLLMASKTK